MSEQATPPSETLPEPTESGRTFRREWLILIAIFTAITLGAMFAIEEYGRQSLAAVPTRTFVPPAQLREVRLDQFGLSLLAPANWSDPIIRDAHSFVISADGSADTRTTAAPFLYVVVDALPVFSRQLISAPTCASRPLSSMRWSRRSIATVRASRAPQSSADRLIPPPLCAASSAATS